MQGKTALHTAVKWGHTGIAELMLSQGADVHAKDAQVTSALE